MCPPRSGTRPMLSTPELGRSKRTLAEALAMDAPTPRTAWERDDEQAVNQAALRASLRAQMPGVLALLSEWDAGGSGQVSLPELRGAIAAVGLVVDQSAVSRLFASIDAHARPLRPSGGISLTELREALREPTWQPPPHAAAAHLGTGLNMASLRAGASCESASCRREQQRGGGARPGSAGSRHAIGATSPTGGAASLDGGGSSRPQSAGPQLQSAAPQPQSHQRPQSAAASRPQWGPTVQRRPGGQRILDAGVKVGSHLKRPGPNPHPNHPSPLTTHHSTLTFTLIPTRWARSPSAL